MLCTLLFDRQPFQPFAWFEDFTFSSHVLILGLVACSVEVFLAAPMLSLLVLVHLVAAIHFAIGLDLALTNKCATTTVRLSGHVQKASPAPYGMLPRDTGNQTKTTAFLALLCFFTTRCARFRNWTLVMRARA